MVHDAAQTASAELTLNPCLEKPPADEPEPHLAVRCPHDDTLADAPCEGSGLPSWFNVMTASSAATGTGFDPGLASNPPPQTQAATSARKRNPYAHLPHDPLTVDHSPVTRATALAAAHTPLPARCPVDSCKAQAVPVRPFQFYAPGRNAATQGYILPDSVPIPGGGANTRPVRQAKPLCLMPRVSWRRSSC